MDKFEQDFEAIYETVCGELIPGCRVPWVENAFVPGTVLSQAYRDFWEAREQLCQRCGIEWEDEALELFMNGIHRLRKDIAWRMFRYGVEYAERARKL